MITPAFDIRQDSDFLTITIKVPYARASEIDIYIEGDDFKFYAKPYFLRLALPGRIVEDGRQKATYNADDGIITVCVPKETPGQHFEGLDLLTSLLAPRGSKSAKPLIEEIGSSQDVLEEEDEFDWQIEQTPFVEPTEEALQSQCTYGFGNLRSGVFGRLQEELNDVIDLRDPDVTPASERTRRRLAAEKMKFDPDHYLADLFEDEPVQHLLKYQPWWAAEIDAGCSQSAENQERRVSFSDKQKEQLRKFTNKSHLLDKKTQQQAYLGLIDLLLAYCYEVRVTEGERNVESAWNIRKLSSTLSWFENFTCIKDALVSFGRRVLCYPLYRHFQLVEKAISDTVSLLKLGKAAVLKCLLEIHAIFQENDPAYILNDLYITDYCIWIQKVKSKKVAALSDCVQALSISKSDLGLELEELEDAARLVQEEEKQEQLAPSTCLAQPLATVVSESSDTDSSTSDTDDSSTDTEDSTSDEESTSEEEPTDHAESEKIFVAGQDSKAESSLEKAGAEKYKLPAAEKAETAVTEEMKRLTEKMNSAVILSEPLMGPPGVTDKSLDKKAEEYTMQPAQSTSGTPTAREFLEVTPRLNPLLIVPLSDEDDELAEH
ncbi:hypothetical protein XELAEV_18024088mg [Xenopus laevis]|uniref:Protein SHQ1 homolog n=1 Tax=Xenopus laevis TaxID=8355 RepID=A0A974D691_XENLA|nr:hypothetical protein XELAEV_18024088mg [Xenopus laevis]OCT85919.1 hypothetical protein XELAEV_18024088mg [Xenopus laevis]